MTVSFLVGTAARVNPTDQNYCPWRTDRPDEVDAVPASGSRMSGRCPGLARYPVCALTPYHWILDEAGAHIVAAHQGVERRRLRWRHSDALGVTHSGNLTHHVEINEFFTLLAQDAQTEHGALRSGTANASPISCSRAWPRTGTASSPFLAGRPCICCLSLTVQPSRRSGFARR